MLQLYRVISFQLVEILLYVENLAKSRRGRSLDRGRIAEVLKLLLLLNRCRKNQNFHLLGETFNRASYVKHSFFVALAQQFFGCHELIELRALLDDTQCMLQRWRVAGSVSSTVS